MLVMGANLVMAFTFCFIEDIPFLDTKCHILNFSFEKFTFGHFEFDPRFSKFFKE